MKRWGFTDAVTGRRFVHYALTRDDAALAFLLSPDVGCLVLRANVHELPPLESGAA